jgi:hypothetical protein
VNCPVAAKPPPCLSPLVVYGALAVGLALGARLTRWTASEQIVTANAQMPGAAQPALKCRDHRGSRCQPATAAS